MVFQIVGGTLLAAFYAAYFAKLICQKRKGIKVDLLGKGKTGIVKAVEITTKIVTFLTACAEIVSIVLGFTALPIWASICGVCIGAGGVLVFIVAVVTMRDSWRVGVGAEKTQLITGGIYKISRNPAFFGFDLVYIGILLTFFHWALLAVTFVAIVMLHLQIVKVEEPFLRRIFGEEYTAYANTVFRYFGRRFKEISKAT